MKHYKLKLLISLVFFYFHPSLGYMTEGHITIIDDNGYHRVTKVSLYSLEDLSTPLKSAYSYGYNCCGWPHSANFAFDTESSWDPNAQWTYPNHVLPGTYRLRIDNKYVILTIVQSYCEDFFLRYQYGVFTVIIINNPQLVQVGETKDWDINFTFEQKMEDGQTDVGTVAVWSGSSFYPRYTAPYNGFIKPDMDHAFHADTNVYSSQKYNKWDDIDNIENHRVEYVDIYPFTIRSNLKSVHGGIIIHNELIDAPTLTGNTYIEFKDPWLVDVTDSRFYEAPYGYRNLEMNAPFKPESSPFHPTTASKYKGVFLNQGGTPPNLTPPYYTVRVPQSQNIGGYNANFAFWTATGLGQTVVTNPTSLESPVIFKGANDTVKAVYKGHMLSSSSAATGPNNQRKIVTYNQENDYLITYESQGKIWYTFKADGNITPEWLAYDVQGFNMTPSLIVSSNSFIAGIYDYCVWHNINNGKNKIIFYSYSSGDILDEISEFAVHPEISPAPVIGYNYISYGNSKKAWESHINIAWTHSGGIDTAVLRYGTFPSGNGEWKKGLFANGRYRPSIISSGPLNELIYFSYDDNRGVYWRKKSLDLSSYGITEEKLISGSSPPYINFSGKSQIASDNYNPLVVWEMQEGMAIEKAEPIVEEIGGEIERKPGVPLDCPTKFSVCFAKPESSIPPTKFSSCAFFNSPTVTVLNNGIILMAWTDDLKLWEARSTNGGNSWNVIRKDDEGKFPNLSISADLLSNDASYVFTKGSSSPYEIGLRTNVLNEKYSEGDTREIAVVDKESEAGISIEMPELYLTTFSKAVKKISFSPTLDSSYNIQNIESYLSTEDFTVPQDAESLYISIRMKSKKANMLTSSKNKLKVRFRFTPNYGTSQYTAGVWRFENDHYFDKTIRIPAERLRGRKLRLDVSILGLDRSRQNIIASASAAYYPEVTNQSNAKIADLSNNTNNLPSEYSLEQNYPNPFNPTTVIRYQLPENSYVSLKIYDVLGREVAVLVDEFKEAGYYEVNFDASRLTSGVYYYRLTAGSYTSVKKLLLLK